MITQKSDIVYYHLPDRCIPVLESKEHKDHYLGCTYIDESHDILDDVEKYTYVCQFNSTNLPQDIYIEATPKKGEFLLSVGKPLAGANETSKTKLRLSFSYDAIE